MSGGSAGSSGAKLTPNPLISRGKKVESPQSDAAKAFDGDYASGAGWTTPSAGSGGVIQNAWVKINVGAGPTSLLMVWHHRDTPDYTITPDINFGAPSDYTIEVSPTGADGSFTQVVAVTSTTSSPTYRSRAHRFDFTGMAYVRMSITRMRSTQPNKSRATLTEIDIHDASNGVADTWAFVGGQAIRFAYDGHTKPLWPELVHGKHPGYYPALIDIADVNAKTDYLLQNLAKWLTLSPDFHYWVLNYGLVESEGNTAPAQTKFRANLQSAIDTLKAAGKVPVIPRFEKPSDKNHARAEEFNAIIDDLVRVNGLPSAPDLWAWFASHPEHLCSTGCESSDKIGAEPNDAGYDAINALWATALEPLYAQ